MTSPKLYLFAAAWAVTVIVAYIIGNASADEAAEAATPAAQKERDARSPSGAGSEVAAETEAIYAEAEEDALITQAGGRLPGFPQLMQAYLDNPSDASLQQLNLMIQGLGPRDIADARAMIEDLPPGTARDQLMVELIGRWATFEPVAALEYAQALPTLSLANAAVNEALSGWARADAQGALAWWDSEANLATGRLRNQRFEAIMEGYARADPFSAFQYASSLSEDSLENRRMKNRALETVVESLVRNGQLESALLWANQMPESEGKTSALSEVLEEWARYDPDAAAAYLDTLVTREDYAELRDSMLRTWAQSDPEQAAAYLSNLDPEDPDMGRLTTMLIAQWSRYDIAGPGEWLNSQPPSPEIDRAVAIFTFRAASEDPAGAMTWAESITSEHMRGRLMSRVAGEWKAQDPEAFDAYLEQAEISPEQKAELEQAEASSGRGPWWARDRRR